jgi:hypothetical protein
MPRKTCGLGFDCASMMLCPGIDAGQCENFLTCGAASKYSQEEEFQILQICQREIAGFEPELYRQIYLINRRQAALMMLMQRGFPQSPESLGLLEMIQQLTDKIQILQTQLTEMSGYIAPPGCELHQYSVKRPRGTYSYTKLTAKDGTFSPVKKKNLVKVIHLGGAGDYRSQEAALGIERRNKLLQAKTQLALAISAVDDAIDLLTSSS